MTTLDWHYKGLPLDVGARRETRRQPTFTAPGVFDGRRYERPYGDLENRYGRFLVHRGFESLPLR